MKEFNQAIKSEVKEAVTPELGVFEESSELKKVMMWGLPGAETVLGQLLPKSKSCFEKSFDVLKARTELQAARELIESHGAEVFIVKDEWAKMINDRGIDSGQTMFELKQELRERGVYLFDKYKIDREKEISTEKHNVLKEGGVFEEPAGLEVLDILNQVLDADVEKYGENAAVVMNRKLSLEGYTCKDGEKLPLSNMFYTRDQSNLLGKTWVWSSMRHDIRKSEVSIYKEVVRYSGLLQDQDITEIEVRENEGRGLFEGGDGIVNNGIAYIGLGGRTDLDGIMQIAKPILESGLRVLVVRDRERSRMDKDHMDAMHLDTFFMPTDVNQAVACEDEIAKRKVYEIICDDAKELGVRPIYLGTFQEHLNDRGVEMVPITKEEQLAYAPNFLNLGQDDIILSRTDKNNLIHELTIRGKEVSNVDFQEVTKGYGGLHCATASISRVK